MQLDRPPAKIRSKSDSNRLLIDFFDPISAVPSIVETISIRNPDHYIQSSTILIGKMFDLYQKLVEIEHKLSFWTSFWI